MPRRARRQFTLEQKASIVRRRLMDKAPVSALCDEYELQPSLFYTSLKQALGNLPSALAPQGKGVEPRERKQAAEIAALKDRLAKKDSVVAEISAEYVQLKKEGLVTRICG